MTVTTTATTTMTGGGDYNRNARVQATAASFALPLLERAAREAALPTAAPRRWQSSTTVPRRARIQCPSWHAALKVIRAADGSTGAVRAQRPAHPTTSRRCSRPLASPAGYLAGDAAVFACAVGRSFYEPVVPADFVSLGWSSTAGALAVARTRARWPIAHGRRRRARPAPNRSSPRRAATGAGFSTCAQPSFGPAAGWSSSSRPTDDDGGCGGEHALDGLDEATARRVAAERNLPARGRRCGRAQLLSVARRAGGAVRGARAASWLPALHGAPAGDLTGPASQGSNAATMPAAWRRRSPAGSARSRNHRCWRRWGRTGAQIERQRVGRSHLRRRRGPVCAPTRERARCAWRMAAPGRREDRLTMLELPLLRSPLIGPAFAHGFSTRAGGVSAAPFDSLNMGARWGDVAANVEENRRRLLQRGRRRRSAPRRAPGPRRGRGRVRAGTIRRRSRASRRTRSSPTIRGWRWACSSPTAFRR